MKEYAPGTFELNTSVSMEMDEHGLPVSTGSMSSYVGSLLSAGAYYIRRLFSSKEEEIEKEDSAIVQLTAFLKRIQVRLEINPFTGSPVLSVGLEEEPIKYRPGGYDFKYKRYHAHILPTRKRKARQKRMKMPKQKGGLHVVGKPSVTYNPSVGETTNTPCVVESQQGRVVYQIQNVNVYLTAEVVTQLNINPQKVINMIQDQLRTKIDKIEKMEFKPENT